MFSDRYLNPPTKIEKLKKPVKVVKINQTLAVKSLYTEFNEFLDEEMMNKFRKWIESLNKEDNPNQKQIIGQVINYGAWSRVKNVISALKIFMKTEV